MHCTALHYKILHFVRSCDRQSASGNTTLQAWQLIDEWRDGLGNGWMDERMDGGMDGWMDGWRSGRLEIMPPDK